MKAFRKLLKALSRDNYSEEQKSTRELHSARVHHTECNLESDADIANPDSLIKLPKLHSAVLAGKEAEVKKYITKRSINEQAGSKRTALHLAVLQNNASIVQLLLSHGASVEIYDTAGFTPFLKAVELGNVGLVKIFWDRKLNKTQTDFKGNTALHLAVTYGFYKIVELLVKDGTLVNISNDAGDYPLHTATQNESFSIAKVLLENQAFVDVEDKMKRTPLLIAVKIGNLSLVELFRSYKANLKQCDVNGISIREYAHSCKNPNIKSLINEDQIQEDETPKETQIENEDSQYSEQSSILPPLLRTPRSWSVLHPNNSPKDIKSYRKNVKSLSPDFPEDPTRSVLIRDTRCNSFSSVQLDDRNSKSRKFNLFGENASSQFENCRKALDELSLDNLHKCERMKVHNKKKSRNTKVELFPEAESRVPHKFVEVDQSNANEEKAKHTVKKKQKIFDKYSFNGNVNNFSDSSDEDPPFWKNSLDGGYFTGDPSFEERDKSIPAEYIASSSDENSEIEDHKSSENTVLNRLKQITLENQDLETETSVLREATEKLKYDLANCRLMSDVKDTNLQQLEIQMTQVESKYSKAIQKINSFQLSLNNLRQEVDYLKNIYKKSYRINQHSNAKINETKEQGGTRKSEVGLHENPNDIRKLQADVLYWKSKYEEVADSTTENHFTMQNLIVLNFELNRLNEKIKDCMSKNDFAELRNQHEIASGRLMQQILDEANQKLQFSIAEMKRDLNFQIGENTLSQNDARMKEMENENMKQKFLLEISRLTTLVNEKETNEQRLKNQLNDLRNQVGKLRTEKSKSLIKKAYEDSTILHAIKTDDLSDVNFNPSNSSQDNLR